MAAVFVLLCAFSASVSAAATGPGVAHRVSDAETRAARDYWTPQRMRRAAPKRVAMPVSAVAGAKVSASRRARVARGTPTRVPARPARRRARNPFHSVIDDPTLDPYSTHGRIFGRYNGSKFSCSGTVINTPSNRAIMTAGHCLHEMGVWAKHVVFVPAYENGRRPFGSFHAKTLWVLRGWLNENFNFDVGMISVRANPRGKPGNVVGTRGWATGQGRNQFYEAFGYPAGAARGQELRYCRSNYLGDDQSTYRDPGPPTMRIACNMAGGSSGGGWVIDEEFVNSVISYGYAAQRNRLYGPYFGLAVKRLINQVGG
jgi:V8-like Glu-specific endopeptidase